MITLKSLKFSFFTKNNLGKRKEISALIFILTAILLLATACSKKESSEKQPTKKKNVKIKKMTVVTKTLELDSVDEFAEISGQLEGFYDVDLISEVSGKIISISKKLGDSVKKGEEIAKIDNEDLRLQLDQAKANSLSAKAKLDLEQIKFNINAKLFKQKSISEVEYISSKSAFETAKANHDGAKANEQMSQRKFNNSKFVAPVSGKIATLPISIGNYINNGTKVASIVDDRKMKIKTGVGPSLIRKIRKGENVALSNQESSEKFSGKVTAIGAKPGSDNFNYPIEIELENKNNLLSGQLVSGKIKVNSYENVIAINPSSIKEFYDKNFVYIVDSESKVQKRNIEILAEVSEKVIIKSGLSIGDDIVIQGFEFVKENQKVEVKNIADVKTSSSAINKGE